MAARKPDRGHARWARLLIAGVPALALAIVATQLLRVDGEFGSPLGPDRLMRVADARPLAGKAPAHDAADMALARDILASRPIDGRAFRLLAQGAAARGDEASVDSLYGIAVRRAPRDRIALATAADRAFARGDIDGGVAKLDALLRVAPVLRQDVLQRLAPHFNDPRVQRAMVDRLAVSPDWRPALTTVLVAKDADPLAGTALLARLADRTGLTPSESAARVSLLQRLHRAAEARQAWLADLPEGSRAGATPTLFDGGFEHPEVADGYGWRIGQSPGVAIAHESGDVAEGSSALWMQFERRAVEHLRIEQWLALPVGDHRLEFAAHNTTDSTRPFVFEVACQEDGVLLAATEFPGASAQGCWQRVQAAFVVPAGCDGQVLRLRHLARSLSERRFAGALGIDAVRITPGRIAP